MIITCGARTRTWTNGARTRRSTIKLPRKLELSNYTLQYYMDIKYTNHFSTTKLPENSVISDLHIHSRFARATSKYITMPNLFKWSLIKGINILGTGDALHPKWWEEIKEHTTYDNNTGFYQIKSSVQKAVLKELPSHLHHKVYFVPTVETSHIYKAKGRLRRIHIVFVFPTLESAKKLANKLAQFSNISADGRPIFGITARDITEMALEIDQKILIIPAHIWTPHFSLFGSKSGFDKITDAFEDMSEYITTLETGLSSDPYMNRLVPDLDDYILTSNSDAHSLERIGREANIHTSVKDYNDLISSFKTGENLYGTLEFYPQEGKYHYDGHRNCKISLHPIEGQKLQNKCPKCNKPLTIGVLHRVIELAQSNTSPNTKLLERFKSVYLVPLDDILATLLKTSRTSKRVRRTYMELVEKFGSEIDILYRVHLESIQKYDPQIANALLLFRKGKIRVTPGYDGEYGVVKIDFTELESTETNQMSLF